MFQRPIVKAIEKRHIRKILNKKTIWIKEISGKSEAKKKNMKRRNIRKISNKGENMKKTNMQTIPNEKENMKNGKYEENIEPLRKYE